MSDIEMFVANGQRAEREISQKLTKGTKPAEVLQEATEGTEAIENSVTRLRALNPTRFLCRTEVKKFLKECARANRTHKFTEVSAQTLVEINEQVRALLVARVQRLPSKGKTI